MSRSYTREERRKGGKQGRRGEGMRAEIAAPAVSGELTGERAVAIMKRHVDYVLWQMVADGEASESDVEDYRLAINLRIVRSLARFDPSVATIRTYLTSVVGREMLHIYRTIDAYRRYRKFEQLRILAPLEEEPQGVSERHLSDGCRSISELEFRMDFPVFCRMLLPIEKRLLLLRIDGLSRDEIIAETAFTEYMMKCVLANIREKALCCGFAPHGRKAK